MQDLVFLGNVNEEPYTTDEIIAKYSGVKVQSVKRLIRSNRQRLGINGFEIRKLPGRGRPIKTLKLNEPQERKSYV